MREDEERKAVSELGAAEIRRATADQPPKAAVRPHVVASPHGERIDPYYWLRDDERRNPEVLEYLNAENAYKERALAPVRALRDQLYAEIIGRLKQDDASVPYFKNGYWYATRFEPGKEHPILVRHHGVREAPEEIILDCNERAAAGRSLGRDYYQIGSLEISPDSEWAAFCEDFVGRRQYELRFKHLPSGRILEETIVNVESDLAWANDNQTVLYVEKDTETLLGIYVKKHRVGQDPRFDPTVFTQTDTSFYTGVDKSKSDRFLFIHMESTVSSEWRYAHADDPALAFSVFLPYERDHEYQIDHLADRFIIRTNWQARNFRLMEAPIGRTSDRSEWRDLVPHRDDTFIQDFDVFDRFLALSVRSGGLSKISILPLEPDGAEFFIASDEPAYTMGLSVNPRLDTDVVRYIYSSLTTPATVYDYDVRTGVRTLLKRDPVMGSFDPGDYRTEFLFVSARDGKRVPVSLVYRKEFARDGTAPLLQYAYGAYGLSMDPYFSASRLSLLDRGFVFAIAHVRGGQEMGREWYDDGRLLHKRNSFTDFIDVTRELTARGYADRGKIFAMGGSAGGLLVAAVANMSGEAYRGIVAQVPFVDVVTTMLDDSIPLTSNEYDEWGDARDAEYYHYMLSYSPYDRVRPARYPSMLVTTGLWDSQVQYYEPAKWVAKLRAQKTDGNLLLLHVEMEAGHGGKAGRFERYRETAMEYAFIFGQLGME
ncbi:MAG TPA: S9 family peptidase [Steroidobacteraceae bacterium]|jgi:oligopeptidase B|nr:S9 family peptidase [Steroidobacteraceae bacterium]